jgi:hypothetical protein
MDRQFVFKAERPPFSPSSGRRLRQTKRRLRLLAGAANITA